MEVNDAHIILVIQTCQKMPIHQALLTNFVMPADFRISSKMQLKVQSSLHVILHKYLSKYIYLHHFLKTEVSSSSVHEFLAFQQQKRSTA